MGAPPAGANVSVVVTAVGRRMRRARASPDGFHLSVSRGFAPLPTLPVTWASGCLPTVMRPVSEPALGAGRLTVSWLGGGDVDHCHWFGLGGKPVRIVSRNGGIDGSG